MFDSFNYTIGDFVIWLFDFAEKQDDDYYDFCHRCYDELIYEFIKEKEV